MDTLEFRVLGPFEVRRGELLLSGGGGRPQALLALLLSAANESVSVDRLISEMWGDGQPASATNLVQGYVSHWRRLLNPDRAARSSGDRLVSTNGGYCLRVGPHECDLLRFRSGLQEAGLAVSVGDLFTVRRLLQTALDERRGRPFADFASPALADLSARTDGEWLDAVEQAAHVELELGRPGKALERLAVIPDETPLREHLVATKMLALYRLGRQSEALDVFEKTRMLLAEELGVSPGPELAQLHMDILRLAPGLQGPRPEAHPAPVLPPRLSSFIGRDLLQSTVLAHLRSHRLVTLTGPGGSGKTRLSVEVAAVSARLDERRVHFVDLSAVDDARLMWSTVASALDCPPPTAFGPSGVVAMLPPEPLLLVLDNMEQIADAAPNLAGVLAAAPLLSVLATSREPLGVSGEKLVSVPPLEVPDPLHDQDPVRQRSSPAVRLFIERAVDLDSGFLVADQDVAVLAGICRRLDGLPLTLELAAPWTKTLSLRALLERLDRPVSMLAATSGTDQPPRHRTLRAAIDWSYAMLPHPQQRLLNQLSIFRSGASLQGVEAVSDLGDDTVAALADLMTRNLIYRAGTASEPRYRLLETIRDYAQDRLGEDTALAAATRDRHTTYIRALGEEVARCASTPSGASMVRQLGVEAEEVRAVLARLAESGSATERLALIVDCLPLWWDLGHTREGYERLTEALGAVADSAPEDLLAAAHLAAVFLAEASGDQQGGLEHGEHASALARRAGLVRIEALALCLQGNSRFWRDWAAPGVEHIAVLERSRQLAESAEDSEARWGWTSRAAVLGTTTLVLADALRYRDVARARDHAHALLRLAMRPIDAHTESFVQRAAGSLDADQGLWDLAEPRLTNSLALATEAGSQRSQSRSLEELGRLAWARGDLPLATDFVHRALRLARETSHALNWCRCTALAVDIHLESGDLDQAANLLQPVLLDPRHEFARHTLAPRQARLARLRGRPDEAEHHLTQALELEKAPGLNPARVVYLVEAIIWAAQHGRPTRAQTITATLWRDALHTGVKIHEAERRRLPSPLGSAPGPADSAND